MNITVSCALRLISNISTVHLAIKLFLEKDKDSTENENWRMRTFKAGLH